MHETKKLDEATYFYSRMVEKEGRGGQIFILDVFVNCKQAVRECDWSKRSIPYIVYLDTICQYIV